MRGNWNMTDDNKKHLCHRLKDLKCRRSIRFRMSDFIWSRRRRFWTNILNPWTELNWRVRWSAITSKASDWKSDQKAVFARTACVPVFHRNFKDGSAACRSQGFSRDSAQDVYYQKSIRIFHGRARQCAEICLWNAGNAQENRPGQDWRKEDAWQYHHDGGT